MEIWKNIDGFNGDYMISNLGNVKSIDRINSRGHNLKGKILKTRKTNSGYLLCTLYDDGIGKQCSIHRLVAKYFIDNPNNLPEVNHIDENKSNNLAINLEWIDRRPNINYSKNKKSTSIYPGVSWDKVRNKWIAQCSINKKQKNLGRYDDEYDAAQAYVDFCKNNNINYSV